MISEIEICTVKPGMQAEHVRLFAEGGRRIRGDAYGKLEGMWTSDLGVLNQIVRLWSYADLTERERKTAELGKQEAWQLEYVAKTMDLELRRETIALVPIRPVEPPPPAEGRVYELRNYRAHPKRGIDWLDAIMAVMPAREKYSKNVGLWAAANDFDCVFHLWVYRDLAERVEARGRAVADSDWKEFLGKAGPLLREMASTLLIPCHCSPMR